MKSWGMKQINTSDFLSLIKESSALPGDTSHQQITLKLSSAAGVMLPAHTNSQLQQIIWHSEESDLL